MTLRITDCVYTGPCRRETMPPLDAAKFKAAAVKAMEQALAVPEAAALGHQINAADHDVLVLKAGPGQVNCCVMPRQGQADRDAACYDEVRSATALQAKIQALITANTIGREHAAVRKFMKFYVAPTNAAYFQTTERKQHPIAHRSQNDPARAAAHTTEQTLVNRIRFADGCAAVAEAEGFVRALQNGLIGYHVMAHLTPGAGSEAWVVWDPDKADAGADLPPAERAPWMTRPSWIALVHELIHAWRIVTGRCVFRPEALIEDYYEEAMTVGLPPYDGCRFTENAFRLKAGLPLRTFYGAKTKVITDKAARKHLGVT
jgi:hypothetical protein